MNKLKVGILFGGRSGEHEISLLSAASVLKAINKQKYDVVPIGITKDGRWLTDSHAERLLAGRNAPEESGSNLRAGDPQATPGAVVLAKGEAVLVPPVPQARGLMPFESAASSGQKGI
ncbi:MAG TPA: D-alanine--D-alanine ligase A, partial [Candidatus Angelobacter sp.]|nr:D-alanine--D-alanine ligase A [Candidatus Angelobacter sp.]